MYRALDIELVIKKLLLCAILCIPEFTNAKDYLPTIFWHPESPALARRHWSKVVNVQIYQTMTFLCPTNYVHVVRRDSPSSRTDSYYNLYVRDLSPNDTNLDYDTICDPKKSTFVYFCNDSRDDFSLNLVRHFSINTHQADNEDPAFKTGKDYIFFSTSNGSRETLQTNSAKCTMMFRIHFCGSDEICPISSCATYGREEVCMPNPKPKPELNTTAPRDVHITANTSFSLTVTWKRPLTIETNITYYSISYRDNSTQDVRTKLVEPQVQSTILENLKHSTEYKIRVRAYTCKGPGDYSEELSQETLKLEVTPGPDPTGEPTTQASLIASEPKDVTGSVVSSSSLKVNWQKPDEIYGDIMYYGICLQESQNQGCLTKLTEPNKQSATLSNLNSSTSYHIRIRAYTCKGPGSYSKELELKTAGAEPVISARGGCSESTVDAVSLVIGMIIGIFVALMIAIIVWFTTAKRRKPVDKPVLREVTNRGYRQSVSNVSSINNNVNGPTRNSAVELYPIP